MWGPRPVSLAAYLGTRGSSMMMSQSGPLPTMTSCANTFWISPSTWRCTAPRPGTCTNSTAYVTLRAIGNDRPASEARRARAPGRGGADRLACVAGLGRAGAVQQIAELEGRQHAAALARDALEEDGGAGDDRRRARRAAELARVVAIVARARLEVAVVEGGDLAAPALDVDAAAVVREVEPLAVVEAVARRATRADHDRARVAMAAIEGAPVDRAIEVLGAIARG